MNNSLLFLNQESIIKSGGEDIKQAIEVMEEVYSLHNKKDYVLPPKTVLRWGGFASESTRGRVNSMPASIGGAFNSVGIKWIGSSPTNPEKYNLPRASAIIVLNDYETFIPKAVMDGMLISALRTGANSGVAAKYLAKKNSKTVGLVGAGAQSKTQLLALHQVLPELENVKIFDLNVERAEAFSKEMSERLNLKVETVNSAEEAVKGSDVFVTATVTKEPIVKAEWIEKGMLYLHVGSHESHFDVIHKADKIVVDDWEELKHRGVETLPIMFEQGEFDPENIYGQIGEIVNNIKKGRENDEEFIYFNSVGMGIQDVALASVIYENAINKNIGEELELF